MEVRELIKSFRIANGYTQQDMADKMNLDKQTYARMENGKTTMTDDKINRFAKITGKTPREIREIAEDEKLVNLLYDNTVSEVSESEYVSNLIVNNYYGTNDKLSFEIEKLNLIIQHQQELLKQKETENQLLKTLVETLQAKA